MSKTLLIPYDRVYFHADSLRQAQLRQILPDTSRLNLGGIKNLLARCGKFRQDSQYKKNCKYMCFILHSVFVYLLLSLLSEGKWGHVVEFLEALYEVTWRVESASVGNIRDVFVRVGEYLLRCAL